MNTLTTPPEASRAAATQQPEIGRDGREVVYFGGYGNDQKAVDAVAERLHEGLGVPVLGRTALWAFDNPKEARELIQGSTDGEEEAKHVIATSASGAAVVATGARQMLSFTAIETTSPTPVVVLPSKLVKLFVSQWGKYRDQARTPEERRAYRSAIVNKAKEFASHPIAYARHMGKIANTNVLVYASGLAEEGVPTRFITSLFDEMYTPPAQTALDAATRRGVDVVVAADPRLDHEGVVVNTPLIVPYISGDRKR